MHGIFGPLFLPEKLYQDKKHIVKSVPLPSESKNKNFDYQNY